LDVEEAFVNDLFGMSFAHLAPETRKEYSGWQLYVFGAKPVSSGPGPVGGRLSGVSRRPGVEMEGTK
jgi:hypothetical protein